MRARPASKASVGEPSEDVRPPEGRYRIATVAELTGVPVATLRAWERRYGIFAPMRTASGYRLYGADEVAQVNEMRRLCEEQGMAPAEAAQLVSASATRERAGSARERVAAPADAYAASTAAIVEAVTRYDDARLDDELRLLLFLGGAAQVLDRVLVPVMRSVGDLWHAGELSVAQEHFASQKLGTVLRDLVRLASQTDATDRAVFACFSDDEHELGLLGLALRFAEWGWRPVVLGARTPPSGIRSAAEGLSPKLVALSVTVTPARPRARALLDEYAAACGDVPWIVGGTGAPPLADLVERSGGRLAPQTPAEIRALAQKLLRGRHDKRKGRR